MSGVCLDALNPAGCPSMEALRRSGATGARLVAFDDGRFFAYCRELDDAGFAVRVVLARESFHGEEWAGMASWYAENCFPSAFVIGNESDAYLLGVPSPSSWSLTPEEYAELWYQTVPHILHRQPSAHCVVGGLVSGQPSYLDELLPLLDPLPYAVDIHPYGRDAGSATDLFNLYRSVALPEAQERLRSYHAVLQAQNVADRLYVLEWNRPAEEVGAYETMLRSETGAADFFCYSNGMVPGFGLIDEQGNPTAEGYAFQAAQEATMAEPNAAIKQTMAEFAAAGGEVGQTYTVVDLPDGGQVANTDAGLFVAMAGVPGAQILLDARAKNPFR